MEQVFILSWAKFITGEFISENIKTCLVLLWQETPTRAIYVQHFRTLPHMLLALVVSLVKAMLILAEKLVILPWPRAHTPTYIFATLTLRVCNHMISTPNIYSMEKVCSSLKYLSKRGMAISKKREKEEKDLCFTCRKKEGRWKREVAMPPTRRREVAMPPTRRKRGAKGVNSTYTIHMHSLGLGLWLVAHIAKLVLTLLHIGFLEAAVDSFVEAFTRN